jgi:hypothetical protein
MRDLRACPGQHRRRCEVPANICVDGPGQHRRRRLLAYLKRVLATPAVYLRLVAGRGATLGAAGGVWGLGWGLGRDARWCRWRCLGPRLRAGARRSVVSLAPKRTFLEQLGGSETWTCFFRRYLTLLVQLKCANVNSKRKCLIVINPLLKISGALIKSFKSEILIILRHPSVYT